MTRKIDLLVESGGMTIEQGERAKKKLAELEAEAAATGTTLDLD